MPYRRHALTAIAATLALPAVHASTYPSRPLRLVIPFPGGFTDTLARLVGQRMSESMGQPVVVEQKPGGSGQIAAGELLRAPADGYTAMLIHIGTHAINPSLFPKLNYDAEKDFQPIGGWAALPNLLIAAPELNLRSVADLVALAKAKPGALAYASPGSGSTGHLAGELFRARAGIDVVHVPYKGASEIVRDLVTGRVQFAFDSLAAGAALAKDGKVTALAITSERRHERFPDYPTMVESGFAGWSTGPWFGLAVRAGTPTDIVARLASESVKAVTAPEVRDRLQAMGANVLGSSPEPFAAFIRSESQRWGQLVRQLNLKAE